MQKILIISSVWVEPNSSAAGSRMLQLINVFQSQNWNLTYVSTSSTSSFSFNLESIGVKTAIVKLNDASFDVFLTELKPSIVLFDRFMIEEQFGWRVAEILPNCLRILDTEDLHCLRKTRQIAHTENRLFKELDLLKSEIAKREIASILRCDLSLIISSYEMELLKRIFKIDRKLLCYIPFLLEKISNKTQLPHFNNRNHFYFIGNFLHQPNVDSVLFLKKEIWPLLSKKLPKTELHIYGAYPTQQIKQLHNPKERFIIKGRLDNVANIVMHYKVCLAPIRFGAGLKGKLIEAMQNGIPAVTTQIGKEGMHQNLDWCGFIADKPERITNKAMQLYTDEKIWEIAQKNGFQIINTCYNKEKFSTVLILKIIATQKNLQIHRNSNFIGSLLNYHNFKSTKYFSKWIEEKNK